MQRNFKVSIVHYFLLGSYYPERSSDVKNFEVKGNLYRQRRCTFCCSVSARNGGTSRKKSEESGKMENKLHISGHLLGNNQNMTGEERQACENGTKNIHMKRIKN